MLKFKLRMGLVVSLDVDDPNASAPIAFEGNEILVRGLRDRLSKQYGAFGHLIGAETTAIDIHAAMLKPEMQEYRPELVQGAELVRKYDPGIPEGAVT